MKRFFACLIFVSVILSTTSIPFFVYASPDAPSVSAECAVLIDASDGAILYEKNAHIKKGMASTTKIMTALVAAEALSSTLDTPYDTPEEAIGVEGSSIYLTEEDSLTPRQLIYALMLASANDAAEALAIISAGSVEAFAEMMNDRAEELELDDTNFVNPHGLYDEDHYTTAYELALITVEALCDPVLSEIAATYKTTIPQGDKEHGRVLVNHNKLLRLYDGAIGVKTGFTKKTGRCLVSAAERNGLVLIAVTLNAPDDWNDHIKLLDFGFENYEAVTIYEAGEFIYHQSVVGGKESYVVLSNSEPITFTLPKYKKSITRRVFLTGRFCYAPIKSGSVYGEIVCTANEKTARSPLVALYSVEKAQRKGFWDTIISFFADIFKN